MGHGCHDCGSPNSCKCPETLERGRAEIKKRITKTNLAISFDGTGPGHYRRLDPQPHTVIRNWKLDWPKASALKYIARAGFKGTKEDEKKDIQKAIDFLTLELQWLNESV